MATVPTNVTILNSANVASYFQFRKDNGQDLTAEAIVVRETGELVNIQTVSGTKYVCGREFLIPAQVVALGPHSATTASVMYFNLPNDKSVLLTAADIVTNASSLTGSAFWTVALTGYNSAGSADAGVTFDDHSDTNSTDTIHTVSAFATNPMPAGSLRVVLGVTKTSTPGNLTLYAALRGRYVIATLT